MTKCPECGKKKLRHFHQEAHGLAGTHMSGSERYVCSECNFTLRTATEAAEYELDFFFDK